MSVVINGLAYFTAIVRIASLINRFLEIMASTNVPGPYSLDH